MAHAGKTTDVVKTTEHIDTEDDVLEWNPRMETCGDNRDSTIWTDKRSSS